MAVAVITEQHRNLALQHEKLSHKGLVWCETKQRGLGWMAAAAAKTLRFAIDYSTCKYCTVQWSGLSMIMDEHVKTEHDTFPIRRVQGGLASG